jgi:Zn-dependent peptidase ImmA (M78 family)
MSPAIDQASTFFRMRNRAIGEARRVRTELGLTLTDPISDVLELVESDGMGVAILDLGDGVAGAYLRPLGAALAFVNGADPPQRQRFTLAHEYGHHRLGHAERVDAPPALVDFTTEPDEVQANVFAAEFLMPRAAAARWAARNVDGPVTLETVVRFAAAFGVSAHAACIRLRTAKVAPEERCARMLGEIGDGEHKGMVDALGLTVPDDAIARASGALPRLPAALRDSGLGALLAGRVTVPQLAGQLGRHPDEVRASLDATGLAALLPPAA